jgi:hypothetical protein
VWGDLCSKRRFSRLERSASDGLMVDFRGNHSQCKYLLAACWIGQRRDQTDG